jgi:Spy/CpxP family protein refolding chaperone
MNKTLWFGAIVLVLALGPQGKLWADEAPTAAANGRQAWGPGGEGMGPRLAKMKDALGLTDEQVAKIQAIADSQKDAINALRQQTLTDMNDFRAKSKAGAKDEELKPLVDKIKTDRESMQEIRKKLTDQFQAVLTPEQEAKLEVIVEQHHEQMKKMLGQKGVLGKDQGTNGPTPTAGN